VVLEDTLGQNLLLKLIIFTSLKIALKIERKLQNTIKMYIENGWKYRKIIKICEP